MLKGLRGSLLLLEPLVVDFLPEIATSKLEVLCRREDSKEENIVDIDEFKCASFVSNAYT